MKKLLFLLFTLLALQGWGIEVTYDYTTATNLEVLGFTESEYQVVHSIIPTIRNKVLAYSYVTMTYEHILFLEIPYEGYYLRFLDASSSNNDWGENWCGQLKFVTKIGWRITKVVVKSRNSATAERVNITLGNATSFISGAYTTCIYDDGSKTATLSGESAQIQKITVTYESYNIYDLNQDGVVDPDDMNEMLQCWLVTQDSHNPNFDLDSNGIVDIADVNTLLTFLMSNPMNMDVTPYIGWGDVNGNGRINAGDYNLILDFAMEYENANNGWACNNAEYDLNDDGKCDFWDYFIVYFLVEQGYTTPAHSGNIVFEDASTKAACVSCYDLNGDGELSYREAARVKPSQLQDIAGNINVEHFDEFQYFTGITELPDDCFMQWGSLRTITLPDGLKKVSRMAFTECYNLQRVVLPEGIKSIEYGAFHCANTDETALTTINFPSTLTYIGDYAFGNCSKLANIEFAENSSLDHIGPYAFGGCAALTSFNFESVQRIDGHAFAGTGLTEVNTSADNIGRQAFYTNHPITVNVLRDYMNFYDNDNDANWGLHLPITNPSVSGTKVLVNRAIFSKAYNATTTARDQLHPYIKLRPYTYESDDNEATPFACEVPVVLPVGSKIFIVTGLETGKALSRLIPGRVVPANTGVIVKLPGRVLDQTQVWQLTADPTATSDADFSDNILQAAVDGVDVNSNNQCFEWVTFFRDNHCSYGFQTNMDAVNFGGCYAFLNVPISQLPSGSTPYSFGDFYEMYLTVPEVNGDVNGDELTDVTDVNIVINIILGKAQAADYPGSADLNNDNEVDVSDVNTIVNIILGKEPAQPEVTVTYDYTTSASLVALGFDAGEIPHNNQLSVPKQNYELNDQYATMVYNKFWLYPVDDTYNAYVMYLCSIRDMATFSTNPVGGDIVWTAKDGKKIKKIDIQSYNSEFANYVRITSSDTGATVTVNGDMTTCTFSSGGVSSATISAGEDLNQPAAIYKITVTYQ